MQSTASNSPATARWKTVSGEWGAAKIADCGPKPDWWSLPIADSSETAGFMISISSRPILPDSPACGFNPATAMRGGFFDRQQRKSASNKPTRTISDCLSALETLLSGMWVVTSPTVIFPPLRHIAKFLTPQRSAKNSFCPAHAPDRNRICSIEHEQDWEQEREDED